MKNLKVRVYWQFPLVLFLLGLLGLFLTIRRDIPTIPLLSQVLFVFIGLILVFLLIVRKLFTSIGLTLFSLLLVVAFFMLSEEFVIQTTRKVEFLMIKDKLEQSLSSGNVNAKIPGIECIEIRSQDKPKMMYFLQGMTAGGFMSSGSSWGYLFTDKPLEQLSDNDRIKVRMHNKPNIKNGYDFIKMTEGWYYLSGDGSWESLLSPDTECYTKMVNM